MIYFSWPSFKINQVILELNFFYDQNIIDEFFFSLIDSFSLSLLYLKFKGLKHDINEVSWLNCE
jgi:hypothetical protein